MKNRLLFALFMGLLSHWATAQTRADTTLEAVPLNEAMITANRISESRSNVAQQVSVLRRGEIEQSNAQSTADLIANSGAAFVQKSQQGGGSPTLRGFEASRILLVVDGVRMNNAIYRAGHLQNIITMDNAALDHVEILYGPASTAYGTDALGGAISFYTKNPVLSTSGDLKVTGSASTRYGTVNEEKTAHADLSLGIKKLGLLSSFTVSDFGDLRMGENPGFDGPFGKRDFYVERIGGRDSLLRNSDPYVQKHTGYRQYDVLEKLVFRPNERFSHTFNFQYSNTTDIPRYDRLTDPNANTVLNSAEWYYGPQKRLLAAYQLQINDLGWFDQLNATASWQDIEESRHNRNFGAANRTNRIEKVKVYGLTLNLQKNWAHQNLQLGIDGQYNDVESTANRENVNTAAITPVSTRYPDGGNTMSNAALFVTHQWRCNSNEAWTFSEGVRLGFASLDSKFKDKTFFPFPFDDVQQSNPVASGSLGLVYKPADSNTRIALNASTGFRVPNVDDLAKVFESQKGSVIVPNPDLKPEQSFNLDFNVTHTISDKLRWENVAWGTLLRNAIITNVFQFNGQDSIMYDGVLSRVLANQNERSARLWGFTSSLDADMYDNFAVYASVAFTKGQIIENEGNIKRPLDHIPPIYGRFGMRYHDTRAVVEGFLLFNGKKPIEDYNLEGEDNQQYAPPAGAPAWVTANLRGSYRFGRFITLQAGLDNILDTQYRLFASGINAPGRNLFVALRVRF